MVLLVLHLPAELGELGQDRQAQAQRGDGGGDVGLGGAGRHEAGGHREHLGGARPDLPVHQGHLDRGGSATVATVATVATGS